MNAGKAADTPCWVAGWLTLNTASTDNTITAMLVDNISYPNGAYLGPYIKITAAFKCPADRSSAMIFGPRMSRVRSLSMNNFVGAPSRSNTGNANAILNPQGSGKYPPYRTLSSIQSTSLTFVFLDEREDSINDGTFFTAMDKPGFLPDVPASYHGGLRWPFICRWTLRDSQMDCRVDYATHPIHPDKRPRFDRHFRGCGCILAGSARRWNRQFSLTTLCT